MNSTTVFIPWRLEPSAGVYILRKGSKVVYVGQTSNLAFRLVEHRHKSFDSATFAECKDKKQRLKLESELIKAYKPAMNIKGKSVKRSRFLGFKASEDVVMILELAKKHFPGTSTTHIICEAIRSHYKHLAGKKETAQ